MGDIQAWALVGYVLIRTSSDFKSEYLNLDFPGLLSSDGVKDIT